MGLIDDLGFEARTPNRLQRVVGRIAGTGLAAKAMAPLLHRFDQAAVRLTGGRRSLSSWTAGQEIVWLSVTGRRSGKLRRVPLIPFPIGGDLAVIGSNFGKPGDPAWVLNLEAAPEIEVTVGDRTVPARARGATAEEAEAVWFLAGALFPGYLRYRSQVTSRLIKVFILESRRRLPSPG